MSVWQIKSNHQLLVILAQHKDWKQKEKQSLVRSKVTKATGYVLFYSGKSPEKPMNFTFYSLQIEQIRERVD